jgi:acyl-CoA dehydrogenase
MADNAIGMAVAYANERRVFKNTPIGAYQSIAHPLAEAKVMLEASRLMAYRAAWAYDAGHPPGKVGTMANMAKLLAADNAFKAVDSAIETHGGNGFTEEYGLYRMFGGARLFKTAPISREMLLNYVAEWELGLPKSY